MYVTRLTPAEVLVDWWNIWPVLYRAVERSRDTRNQLTILGHIIRGEFQCFGIDGEAKGVVVTCVGPTKDNGLRCLWIIFAAGQSGGVKTMQRLLKEFEQMAWEDGCDELRIEARSGWKRIAQGYQEIGNGQESILRKVLNG